MRLRSSQKRWDRALLSEMLLFCANTVVRESAKFELAHLKKEEEKEKIFGGLATFWCVTFATVFTTLGVFLARIASSTYNARKSKYLHNTSMH